MVINRLSGTPQLVFANERVRLAVIDDSGRRSYAAYVHRTKTTHQFKSADAMQDFAEHMGLIPATETLRRHQIKSQLQPFIALKWQERCKPGMNYKEAWINIQKGHIKVRGSGLMKQTTWTEFDAEMAFQAPKGIFLDITDEDTEIHMHQPGCGWTYEIFQEILRELVANHGGDPNVRIEDIDIS